MTVVDFRTLDFEGFSELISQRDYTKEKVRYIIDQLREASSEQGFFYIENHGISQQEIDRMFSLSKEYFRQPTEIKSKDNIKNNVGYSKLGNEKLGSNFQDYKESFNFRSDLPNELLPEIFKSNLEFFDEFWKKTWALSKSILTGLALSLDLDPDYFNQAHTKLEKTRTTFRLLHYPPVNENVSNHDAIRAGRHSDFGSLTILFQQTSSEEGLKSSTGLQVLQDEKDAFGEEVWSNVPAKHGTVVVNIAGLLSLWTEGRFKSAVHRVIIPDGDAAQRSRYTFAHFILSDSSFEIYPVPSPHPPPRPAIEVEPGLLKASFGESPFYYGETSDIYSQRRMDDTKYQ